MPLYCSAHNTAYLTRQALLELMQALMAASEVKVHRLVASEVAGRMLAEVEAPDQEALQKFFEARQLNCAWVMRIDIDAQNGGIREF